MRTAVSNSSPIIYLGKIGRLHLLKELYGEVIVPEAVWRELIRPLVEAWEEVPEYVGPLLEARRAGWIRVEPLRSISSLELVSELGHLDPGEREAIALALEKGISIILTNDKGAHDEAISRGLNARWFTEILLDALRKGLIRSVEEFEQVLREAVRKGLWVSKEVFNRALESARRAKEGH